MRTLSWFGIFRLGLVQTALGAIVVLTTSTMNRVMVVELALPAMLPGLLVGLHSALQMSRPRWGYGSDMGGRRTPWILGGMFVLALGGVGAAAATAWMATSTLYGVLLAVLAYTLIGIGVGAAGTSVLAMLASCTAPARRAPAASMVWLMMIFGFIVTAGTAGSFLDPYTPKRLVVVTACVAAAALTLACIAMLGLERSVVTKPETDEAAADKPPFMEVFREVWADEKAKAFTVFVFVSMLAYNTQDLILEPFAGAVFGLTPGESTKLAGVQHSGVFVGMLVAAFLAGRQRGLRFGSIRAWTTGGCIASGLVLVALCFGGLAGAGQWPLRPTVFALGLSNGAFAVAAIGWMMALAGDGPKQREGVRMGLWGGAQAVAFALGALCGTAGVDLMRALGADSVTAYASVFAVEAALFVVAAGLAFRMERAPVRALAPMRAVAVAGEGTT